MRGWRSVVPSHEGARRGPAPRAGRPGPRGRGASAARVLAEWHGDDPGAAAQRWERRGGKRARSPATVCRPLGRGLRSAGGGGHHLGRSQRLGEETIRELQTALGADATGVYDEATVRAVHGQSASGSRGDESRDPAGRRRGLRAPVTHLDAPDQRCCGGGHGDRRDQPPLPARRHRGAPTTAPRTRAPNSAPRPRSSRATRVPSA